MLHKFPVVQHVLFGSILSIAPAVEVVYHPPGTDMPSLSGKLPGAPSSSLPPRPGPRIPPFTDAMPQSIPNIGRMQQDLPLKEGLSTLPTIGKMPQALIDTTSSTNSLAASRATTASCADERHPAMSPLNPLTSSGFTKCNLTTENTNESTN